MVNFWLYFIRPTKWTPFVWSLKIVSRGYFEGGGAFCWNANGCWREGGRGQKSWKYADVLNGWSLIWKTNCQFWAEIIKQRESVNYFGFTLWDKKFLTSARYKGFSPKIKSKQTAFSNFSCRLLNPKKFPNLNSNCSNLLDLRNLQEQVKKAFFLISSFFTSCFMTLWVCEGSSTWNHVLTWIKT